MRWILVIFAVALLALAVAGLYLVLFHEPQTAQEPRPQDDDEEVASEPDLGERDRREDPREEDEQQDEEEPAEPHEQEEPGEEDPGPHEPSESTDEARLHGTVVDEHGIPVGGAKLIWTQQKREQLERRAGDWSQLRRLLWREPVNTESGPDGTFELEWPSRSPERDEEQADAERAGLLVAGGDVYGTAGIKPLDWGHTGEVTLTLTRGSMLEVLVLDSEGEPLHQASVTAARTGSRIEERLAEDPRELSLHLMQNASHSRSFQTTDEHGIARLGSFAADGLRHVIVQAEAHAPRGMANLEPATQGPTELTVQLGEGVGLAGVVLDQLGESVPHATVVAGPARRSAMDFHPFEQVVQADLDGRFEISGLMSLQAEESYSIAAAAAGYAEAELEGVAADGEEVRIELERLGMIVATLDDPQGQSLGPADGVSVRLAGRDEWEQPTIEWIARDEQGRILDPEGKPDERYERPGATIDDLHMPTNRGFGHRGRERSAAQSVEQWIEGPDEAATEEPFSGTWYARIIGLEPGEYGVVAEHPHYPRARISGLVLNEAELVTRAELQFAEGASLHGRVTGPDGEPMENAQLAVLQETEVGDFEEVSNARRSPRSGPEGQYEVRGLDEGRLLVFVIGDSSTRLYHRKVEISEGRNELDVQLEAGLSITGKVVYEHGAPVEEMRLQTWRDAPEEDAVYAAARELNRTGLTTISQEQDVDGQLGHFRIRGLGEADYQITAHSERATESTKTVAAGTQNVTITLTPKSRVYGTVSLPDGTHPARVDVAIRQGMHRYITYLSAGGYGDSYEPETGEFELYLDPGSYVLEFSAAGYRGTEESVSLGQADEQRLDVEMGEPGRLTVRVLDPDELPVSEATVRATPAGVPSMMMGSDFGASGVTDGRGMVELEGITESSVTVMAQAEGYAAARESVTLTQLEPDEVVELTLTRGGRVEGEVFNEQGEPRDGATLMIVEPASFDGPVEPVTTDARGQFQFEHVPAGGYMLTLGMPGVEEEPAYRQITVREGETTYVRFGGEPKVLVEGRVTRDGSPVEARRMGLFGQDGEVTMSNVELDAQARFELRLRPGRYVAIFDGPDLRGSFHIPLRVPFGVTSHRVVLEVPSGQIEGVVRDNSGSPVEGIRVFATADTAGGSGLLDNLDMLDPQSSTTTDSNGRFTLSHLPPGSFRVWVMASGPTESEDLAQAASQPTQVRDGSSSHVELRLETSGAVEIHTEGYPADALEQTVVMIYDEGGHGVPGVARGAMYRTSFKEGRARYGSLPAGDYTLFVEVPGYAVERREITIRSGERSTVQLEAAPAGTLRLRVTDAAGARVIPDQFRVYDANGHNITPTGGIMGLWMGAGTEDGSGGRVLEIKHLPAGSHTVQLTHNEGRESASLEVKISAGESTDAEVQLR